MRQLKGKVLQNYPGSVIGPKDSNEDDFYAQIFNDADIDSGFAAVDRTLTDLFHEEIKYYMNKKNRYYKMVGRTDMNSLIYFHYSKSMYTSLQHLFH